MLHSLEVFGSRKGPSLLHTLKLHLVQTFEQSTDARAILDILLDQVDYLRLASGTQQLDGPRRRTGHMFENTAFSAHFGLSTDRIEWTYWGSTMASHAMASNSTKYGVSKFGIHGVNGCGNVMPHHAESNIRELREVRRVRQSLQIQRLDRIQQAPKFRKFIRLFRRIRKETFYLTTGDTRRYALVPIPAEEFPFVPRRSNADRSLVWSPSEERPLNPGVSPSNVICYDTRLFSPSEIGSHKIL